MKTNLILGSLLAFTSTVCAQWNGSNNTSGPIYRGGAVGIGLIAAPAFALDVNTGNALDGIRINQFGTSAGVLRFTATTMAPTGAHDYGIYSSGPADPNPGSLEFYDHTMSASRFFIKNNGNIGIGTQTPYAKMHLNTPSGIGLEIDHTNSVNPYEMAAVIKVSNDMSRPLYVEKITGGSTATIFQLWGTGVVNAKAIYTEGVTVMLNPFSQAWPDYVFKKDYKLMTLQNVEQFIKKNGHLPNVPSELKIKKEGANLGELAKIQMEKIEELTLYIIELNKEVQVLKKELNSRQQ